MAEPEQPPPKSDAIRLRERIKKLRLERISLKRQSSGIEYIKALTTIAAFIGIGATFWVGQSQIKLTREAQVLDRLDKAIIRLSSDRINDRLMGISSLKLFLQPGHDATYADAMYFLIDACASERDTTAQQSILSAFINLPVGVDRTILNQELKVALERNRTLTQSLSSLSTSRMRPFSDAHSEEEEIDLLDISKFSRIKPDEMAPLNGLSGIIVALVRRGARNDDFSSIYCSACDFSRLDLKKTNFNDAYMPEAIFSFADLSNASFKRADIENARFFAANLQRADLSGKVPAREVLEPITPLRFSVSIPEFECADLRGANLASRTLVWEHAFKFLEQENSYAFDVIFPSFRHVIVDKSTKINPLGVVFSMTAPASARVETLLALPWNDLLDSVFHMETDSFLFTRQAPGTFRVMRRRFPPKNMPTVEWAKGMPALRVGQIAEFSKKWEPKADAFKVLLHGLSLGRWRDANIPSILQANIMAETTGTPDQTVRYSTDAVCSNNSEMRSVLEISDTNSKMERWMKAHPSSHLPLGPQVFVVR